MKPLGITLGVDFSKFDRDMNIVADRIESVGKGASIKVGAVAGDIATGKIDTGQISDSVASIGARLAMGMASGVRSASAMMLGLTAHVERMLDKLVGSAVTIFRRIDSAIKFPAFDSFFRSIALRLGNFAAFWRKPLSDLDLAVAGGFGSTVAKISRVLRELIDGLTSAISGAMKDAVAQVAAEFAKLGSGVRQAEADASLLLKTTEKIAAVKPSGMTGLKSVVPGPRIGTGTSFTAPVIKPQFTAAMPKPAMWAGFKEELSAVGSVAATVGGVFARLGAAVAYVPVRSVVAYRHMADVLSSIGDVGKASFRKLFESHNLLVRAILAPISAVSSLTRALVSVGSLGTLGKASEGVAGIGKAAEKSRTSVSQLGAVITSVGSQILLAFGAVGLIIKTIQFFRDGVKGASDLNEAVSRSKVVFGDTYGSIEAQANQLTRSFGLSRKAQIDIASGFGAMAQGAGMSETASASLANQLTKMAADLSSSVNISFDEAGQKIRSALAGEAEPLRQFGALLTEDAVKAYALSHGLATAGGEISNQAKITARAALIMQGLSYAQGDLERTADAAANQFRKAGGGIDEFGVRIGQILLPAINLGTQAFNTLLEITLEVFEGAQPMIMSWMSVVTTAFEKVGMVARNLGAIWKITQLRIGEFVINSIAWVETIPQNFGPITEWIKRNWWNMLQDLGSMLKTTVLNLLDNAKRFGVALWNALKGEGFEFDWTPLLDGFKATTEKLPDLIKPDLISVDDEVNKLWDGIAKKEADRMKAIQGGVQPKKPGEAAAAPDKPKEYKLAGAAEITSKEAFSALSRNNAGARSNDMKESVGVQKTIAATVRDHLEYVKAHPPIALAVK